jgi:plasmid stability protein
MSKLLQVRHLPDALHRRLKVRAAQRGLTLSDYVLSILRRADAEPSIDEWLETLRTQPQTELSSTPAELIRSARPHR